MMQITDEQKKAVEQWVKEGCGLSEIQKRLSEEFKLSMTYMDVRFLMIDMGLNVKDKPSAPPVSGGEREDGNSTNDLASGNISGKVSVEIDRITKPGFLVSGTVCFSDGVSADWSLDQFGRLMLQPSDEGYKPSEEDLKVFQTELKNQLAKKGF